MSAGTARTTSFVSAAAASFALVAAFAGTAPQAMGQGIDGEAAFNNACRTCHTTRPGDNRLGPHLNGIVGRKAGSAEGFNYSQSMKSSGITWDEASLDKFIANPDAVVQNNNMKPYTGLSDPGLRKAIIGFLKTRS